ncbi:restriction endonuclease subunit S [Staphylococcus chromogenes]|uniref:restriction endonuclease subunit S n=1 Tax=Staphylococcus chromogenes TaxID=46126 RepID=UPI0034DB4404
MTKTPQHNVPELRFPEFEGEWEEKKLGEVSNKLTYGLNAAATDFDGENAYIRITDINEKNRQININKLTSPSNYSEEYLVENNDILFARTGASTGKTYIHNAKKDLKFYYAGFLIKSKVKEGYSSEFIYQNTLTNKYNNWVDVMSVRSGQPGINSKEYSKFNIYFPSFNEQQKIGEFFSKLDHQIELEEKKLELLEQQKKGYMQKLFSQEIRFKDNKGNNYPDWKIVEIGDVLEERTERSGEGDMLSVTINNGIIKFDEIDRKDNSSKDKSNYRKVYKDDIAYNSMRMWQGASGKSEYEGIVSPAYTVTIPSENINPDFIAYYFKTHKMIHKFKINSQGLTSDTWNLKYRQLKDIKLNLCSKEEQNKIANLLIMYDKLINKQKHKLEILKTNKKGFLQKMFV